MGYFANEQGNAVSENERVEPIQQLTEDQFRLHDEERGKRTVYVFGIPAQATNDEIRKFISKDGKLVLISFRLITLHIPKQRAGSLSYKILYESEENAKEAVDWMKEIPTAIRPRPYPVHAGLEVE